MIVLSVASGIGCDAVAWAPLGWTHRAFAEIAKFPSAVLAHHFPAIPNLGDFTKIKESDVGAIDLLVGGTPCQDFSISGLRAGLAGANGVLALEFLRLVARLRPRWVTWENVVGALSADGGRALGTFLGGLAELGYGFAYRVLDAQYFGLAQRRKRVFVVGHSGGAWQRCAAVLFERASLRGDPAPSRETGAHVAGPLTTGASRGGGWRIGADEAASGHVVAHALTTRTGMHHDPSTDTYIAETIGVRERGDMSDRNAVVVPIQDPRGRREQNGTGIGRAGDPSYTLESHPAGVAVIPFDTTQITNPENRSRPENGDPSPSLSRTGHPPAIAFHATQDPISGDRAPSLGANASLGVLTRSAVRRFTPRECERLMGYPDGYTLIPYGGGLAKDGPRYAALGNGIAVTVLAWLGRRIAMVDRVAA